jgi:hypothetical protein
MALTNRSSRCLWLVVNGTGSDSLIAFLQDTFVAHFQIRPDPLAN